MPDSTFHLPTQLAADVSEVRAEWERAEKLDRLWKGDASLWTGGDEDSWLGWLEATDPPAIEVSSWLEFGREARDARFRDALLIGMGGSSLCPDVLARSFGPLGGHPRLHVLDSTVPEQIRSIEEKLDLHHTLCLVASKSGSTLEPRALMQYFWRRLEEAKGRSPGGSFVAITDPGSQLEIEATEGSFRRIFHGVPSIGGRFSARNPRTSSRTAAPFEATLRLTKKSPLASSTGPKANS